jgi:transposase
MAHQGRRTTFAERVDITTRATAGQTDPEIAAALGLSVSTVRKWRRKAHREGRAGLVSRLGRPSTGALGGFPSPIREAVGQMRRAHPGWGPLTLRLELEADPRFVGQKIPSRSRIAAFLHQEELTRRYERHRELPQPRADVPHQVHEEWEMDAQGKIQVPPLGTVSLIGIGDVVSRLKVASLACVGTSKPHRLDYQRSLRRAFLRHGLPTRLSLDHDSVFYDNTSASPYPTPLHLWVVALGVDVRFIRKGRPTDHGIIERSHQTITRQAILGQHFPEEAALQGALDQRRAFLNGRFPCRSLDHQPPLVAYPQATHSGRFYYPEWEEGMIDLPRVHAYLAQGSWFRRVSTQGQFSLGAHRYGVGKALANQTLEISFDPHTQDFVCHSEDGQQTVHVAAKGLTKKDLMGHTHPSVGLPAHQLALPLPLVS